MVQRYIEEYLEDFPFSFTEQIRDQLCGVDITIDVMLFREGYQRRQMANVLLKTADRLYECLCVDVHSWDNMFYPVMLKGRQLLCFRKTLYGFTLLDAATLEEVYDYFPAAVMDGEESFIITGAEAGFGLLFFSGCYWADSYGTYVFDPDTQRFAYLSNAVGLGSFHSKMRIYGDRLILETDSVHSVSRQVTLSPADIHRILAEEGTTDM